MSVSYSSGCSFQTVTSESSSSSGVGSSSDSPLGHFSLEELATFTEAVDSIYDNLKECQEKIHHLRNKTTLSFEEYTELETDLALFIPYYRKLREKTDEFSRYLDEEKKDLSPNHATFRKSIEQFIELFQFLEGVLLELSELCVIHHHFPVTAIAFLQKKITILEEELSQSGELDTICHSCAQKFLPGTPENRGNTSAATKAPSLKDRVAAALCCQASLNSEQNEIDRVKNAILQTLNRIDRHFSIPP